VAEANDPCKCLNKGSLFNSAMNAKFSSNYGSSCMAWDMSNCATNYREDQVDSWCCANWCYVDKSCPSAKDSLNDGMQGILYWSDNACPDDTALTLQCPYRAKSNSTPAGDCTCKTEQVPATVMNWTALGLNETTYAGYGTSCLPWDSQECHLLYPSLDSYAMWCCLSWCWVDSSCATARASTLWPGHFFSISDTEKKLIFQPPKQWWKQAQIIDVTMKYLKHPKTPREISFCYLSLICLCIEQPFHLFFFKAMFTQICGFTGFSVVVSINNRSN